MSNHDWMYLIDLLDKYDVTTAEDAKTVMEIAVGEREL